MNALICDAISARRQLQFEYHGKRRIVEPHCYGIHADTGNEMLFAYQVAGDSDGRLPAWRNFHVGEIRGLTSPGQTFMGPREDYDEDSRHWRLVFRKL